MGLRIGLLPLGVWIFAQACAMRETEEIERIRQANRDFDREIGLDPWLGATSNNRDHSYSMDLSGWFMVCQPAPVSVYKPRA